MIGMGDAMCECLPEATSTTIEQQTSSLVSIETTESHPELTNNSNQTGEL